MQTRKLFQTVCDFYTTLFTPLLGPISSSISQWLGTVRNVFAMVNSFCKAMKALNFARMKIIFFWSYYSTLDSTCLFAQNVYFYNPLLLLVPTLGWLFQLLTNLGWFFERADVRCKYFIHFIGSLYSASMFFINVTSCIEVFWIKKREGTFSHLLDCVQSAQHVTRCFHIS